MMLHLPCHIAFAVDVKATSTAAQQLAIHYLHCWPLQRLLELLLLQLIPADLLALCVPT